MIGDQHPDQTLPLEKRKIQSSKNGIGQIIPALHKDWVEPREWMSYQVPPVGKDLEIVGAKEAWMERSIFVLDDLEFVLGLSYHMFWSQVVFDESLQLSLGRLLRLLPRSHDRFSPHPDSDVRGILSDILRKTFLIFLRLSTHKESHVDFMGVPTFGQLIYDKFIFDIPKIMDIAVLFHTGNPVLVEKMIGNIFRSQPSYESDLSKSVVSMGETMVKTVDKIEACIQFSNCDNKKVLDGLLDLVTYTTDVVVSLHHLLKAYPKAATLLHKGVDQPLAGLYQNGLVPLQMYVRTQNETGLISDEISEFLMSRILLARHSSLLAFRALISTCCVTPALEDGHKTNLGDEFLQALSSVISEPKFYHDYINLFPIGDDLDIFSQTGLEVDPLRLQYLNQGGGPAQCPPGPITKNKKVTPPKFLTKDVEVEPSKNPISDSRDMSSVEMDSLISQVRDLLPDLGEGFVERCLQYFDFVPEKVINALLEENLPPHLIELDRKKGREFKKAETSPEPTTIISDDILSNRNNIFDGDEFDINTQTSIDKSRIHRGKKKPFAKNANALLNDKKELAGLKDKFAALSMVSDVVYDVDYDDEYDDTYDDNAMGEREPDADEITERRPFVLPRALGGGHIEHVRQEESSEEEEDESEADKKRMNFARNPEEVRAESERRWNSKMAARGGGRTGPPPNRDVVGRAKGQGQDASVLRNRQRKTENKGKHIRNMADKKMSKGMF